MCIHGISNCCHLPQSQVLVVRLKLIWESVIESVNLVIDPWITLPVLPSNLVFEIHNLFSGNLSSCFVLL